LALFWHIEGEKMVRGSWAKDDYQGRLDTRGLYVLSVSGIGLQKAALAINN